MDLLTHFFRLLGGESRSEEDRAVHALARRPEIRDELGDALKNPAGLLGSAAPEHFLRLEVVDNELQPLDMAEGAAQLFA